MLMSQGTPLSGLDAACDPLVADVRINGTLIRPHLQKLYLIASLQLQKNAMNYLIRRFIKYGPSIFRGRHHLRQRHRHTVALMNVRAQLSMLPPKGREISPVEIELSPDFPCHFHHQPQFRDLIFNRKLVAEHGAGKAALWRDAELV